MKSIFREYDIRGIFEKELTEESVKKIGYFLGREIAARHGEGSAVAVGYDARTHSPVLHGWLVSGLNAAGIKPLTMGLVATPVNYFANYREWNGVTPAGSVMITGSHNPPEYNGFKITVGKGPFFGGDIYALGEQVLSASCPEIPDNADAPFIDTKNAYVAYLADQFAHLKGMKQKLVLDCGNGAAGVVLEPLVKALELDAVLLYPEPDGTFPNHHPDPSEEENLEDVKKALARGGFDYGFAYDGDGDRIAVLSRTNNFKGDELALFLARRMENPTVIGEVKCSQVMYDEINRFGKAVMYKTGHSNLKVKIKELDADFAAEVSGHIFFNDRYFGYDDAVYSTFRVLELIYAGVDMDREKAALPKTCSTDEIKVKTTETEKFPLIDRLKAKLENPPEGFPSIREVITIDGVRVVFDHGWGLVRASNTTPVLVTRFEADTPEALTLIQDQMMALLESCKE